MSTCFDRIAILDAGAQYGKLIDRRIRELNVDTELLPINTPAATITSRGFKGVVISGGPRSIYLSDALKCDPQIFKLGIPVFGICYGIQLMTEMFGGVVGRGDQREDGTFHLQLLKQCPLFEGIGNDETVLSTHGDSVLKVAPGFEQIASTGKVIAAVARESQRLYAVQFHPEVDLTPCGKRIFSNFLFTICGCTPSYTMVDREKLCLEYIRSSVTPGAKVLLLLSGGVDSTVCAALVNRALDAEHVVALHIDTGFMRENESNEVVASLGRLGIKVLYVDASLTFATSATDVPYKPPEHAATTAAAAAKRTPASLTPARTRTLPLNQTLQPEEKRRIIGDTFIRVCNQVLETIGLSPPAAAGSKLHADDADVIMKSANGLNLSVSSTLSPSTLSPSASSVSSSSTANVVSSATGSSSSTVASASAVTVASAAVTPTAAATSASSSEMPVVFVAQGTLRPDLIESASALASGVADAIKTHHNDTELVRQLRTQGRVIEPLKDFHKDEVRQLGRSLGLPEAVVERQPFPGPGLAIRVLCALEPYMVHPEFGETATCIRMLAEFAHASERQHPLITRIQQALTVEEISLLHSYTQSIKWYATLLPIRSVGVQGDCRSYSYVACFSVDWFATSAAATTAAAPSRRSDSSTSDVPMLEGDAASASASEATETPPPPARELTEAEQRQQWQALKFFAKMVPKICRNINRIVFAFGGPVRYNVNDVTPTFLVPSTVAILRRADAIANRVLRESGYIRKISQMPVVLIPVHFDRDTAPIPQNREPSVQRSVVLRPFITNDFMTGEAAIPGHHLPHEVIERMAAEIKAQVNGISRVLYDLTDKPPGTTEWE